MTPKSLALLVSGSLLLVPLASGQPICDTSPENDARVRAVHERARERQGIRTNAGAAGDVHLRDGAMYVRDDDTITVSDRPFDLEGRTVAFTPSAAGFRATTGPLEFVAPSTAPLRDFQGRTGADWFFVEHDLPFAFSFAGRSITRIYVTAFNSVHFDPPVEQTGLQFDAIEAAVHRTAVLSPLMITARKPRFLEYPEVFVEEVEGSVRVTWRSDENAPFGYDLQAELRSDGRIAFSYPRVTVMRWGTPVVSGGFDPDSVSRAALGAGDDATNDFSSSGVPQSLRAMLDIRRVEVVRLGASDLFAVRMQLAAGIDRTALGNGEMLLYQVAIGDDAAQVQVTRDDVKVRSFTGRAAESNGASARVNGNIIEVFGVQQAPEAQADRSVRAATLYRPLNRTLDTYVLGVRFPVAANVGTRDLSGASSAELTLPILEPFQLGVFDPLAVWERINQSYAINPTDIDGVAMFQTFYTDLILYAGAYAFGGNAAVQGVGTGASGGSRSPTLMHMNQLSYNYNAETMTASKVMLHEFGHRWLYFISIAENGENTRSLNPTSAHPAAYVHTPAAFRVYDEGESSVMGGAVFTEQGDGSHRAHAANYGYSWTDLYLMGLADPEEVQPWFYLAGTGLRTEYWPPEGAVVAGEKRNVTIGQVTQALGPRLPTTSSSQRTFRVLFVLVTEEDRDATDAEVAKLTELRELMERNFAIATGGRAKLSAHFGRPAKRRSVR